MGTGSESRLAEDEEGREDGMPFKNDKQDRSRSEQLVEDGFVVCEAVLSSLMVDRLRVATDRVLDTYSNEQKTSSGHQGSIVGMVFQDPVFQELIAWPGSLEALRLLGFDRPRYWSAFIISKEPHAPQTYWHQDWPYWGRPSAMKPCHINCF